MGKQQKRATESIDTHCLHCPCHTAVISDIRQIFLKWLCDWDHTTENSFLYVQKRSQSKQKQVGGM